ncbi:Multi antimicrobial extrusion protein, partial [Parasponia andersonii]
VRVANELGAGNGKGAKFATIVSVVTSIVIGLFFLAFDYDIPNEMALIFSSSKHVLEEVNVVWSKILYIGQYYKGKRVAVGSGWQSYVAYINLGCYYLIGLPLGYLICGFHQGVMGIWAGMIFGGTAVQTLILAIITIRCDWEKEAELACRHVLKWAEGKRQDL